MATAAATRKAPANRRTRRAAAAAVAATPRRSTRRSKVKRNPDRVDEMVLAALTAVHAERSNGENDLRIGITEIEDRFDKRTKPPTRPTIYRAIDRLNERGEVTYTKGDRGYYIYHFGNAPRSSMTTPATTTATASQPTVNGNAKLPPNAVLAMLEEDKSLTVKLDSLMASFRVHVEAKRSIVLALESALASSEAVPV